MTDAEIRESLVSLGTAILAQNNILLELEKKFGEYAKGGVDLATGNILMVGYVEQLERRIKTLEERHRNHTPSVN
jgi:hypothetical protein